MISVVKEREYDALTKAESDRFYIKLSNAIFDSGLVSEIKPVNLTVFLAICSYMDESGVSYPSQESIAAKCGLTRQTVIKAVDELQRTEVNGVPLISKHMAKIGARKQSIYTINPVEHKALLSGGSPSSDESKPEIIVRDKPERKPRVKKVEITIEALLDKETLTGPDVIKLFELTYKEVYKEDPKLNFGRYVKQVNEKLIPNYTSEQLKTMVSTYVQHYGEQWASKEFPKPLIGAMCTFAGEKALAFAGDTAKTKREYEALEEKAAMDAAKAEELLEKQLAAFQEAKKERE